MGVWIEDVSVHGRGANGIIKRAFDIWAAGVGLILCSPILAIVALCLLVTQGRPILFRQQRPGRHGEPFRIAKFRTMREPTAAEIAHETDAVRVTRIGRFLRSTSLDELPELWNVLVGEMSVVGPRPLLMAYLSSYSPREGIRHDVRPGITSWAAVNGRHSLRFRDRLELDAWYVEHWSLSLDLRIIALTLGQVLRRTDVSDVQDVDAIGFPLGVDRPDEPGL